MEIRARQVSRGMDGELLLGDPEVVGIIPSPVDLLKTELQKDGIAFAELHGKSGLTSQQAQNAFAGTTNVLLASVESGGTGINLDDTTGRNPRTEIFMFAPYRGISTVQAMGRIWRASTIQDDNNPNRYAMIVASDVVPDALRSAVLAKKLQLMNAAIGGTAVTRLPMAKTSYDPKQLQGLEIAEDGEASSLDRQPTGILKPVKVNWKPAQSGRYYDAASADVLEWEERGGAERVGIDVRVFKGDRGWVVTADRPYTPEEFALPEEAVPDVPTAPTQAAAPAPTPSEPEPTPTIARDTAKTEQMTPAERKNAPNYGDPANQGLFKTKNEASVRLASMVDNITTNPSMRAITDPLGIAPADMYAVTKTEAGKWTIGKTHQHEIGFAASKQLPVSAEAVDTYGITLPEGYVREGELYVYRPAPTQAPSEINIAAMNAVTQREAEAMSPSRAVADGAFVIYYKGGVPVAKFKSGNGRASETVAETFNRNPQKAAEDAIKSLSEGGGNSILRPTC